MTRRAAHPIALRPSQVVSNPDQPLPALAYDGLPLPSMTLDSMLTNAEPRSQLQQLARKVLTDGAARQQMAGQMATMLADPRVQRRLREMQAQALEEPTLWGKLIAALAPAAGRRSPSHEHAPSPAHAPPVVDTYAAQRGEAVG